MDTNSNKVGAFINDQQHFVFHLSSHAVAFIALIIACFAITGYIRFRNNSIPLDKIHQILPGVKRKAYQYTYPAVTISRDDNSYIGPFTGIAKSDSSNKVSIIAVEIEHTDKQVKTLNGIYVGRGSPEEVEAGKPIGDVTQRFTRKHHTIGTAYKAKTIYENYPFQSNGETGVIGYSEKSTQLGLVTQKGEAVTKGAIIVRYVLEIGPGGFFPPLGVLASNTIEL